jgi:hypothetical protein
VRRLPLVVLGLALLTLAAALRPVDPPAGTWVSAIGRSVGGLRVLAADALFLRVGVLEREGRLEEAAALLDLLLELEPHGDAAIAYLVDLYVHNLLPRISGEEARVAWWHEARRLVERALEERRASARLHLAAADVYLSPPPAVAEAVEQAVLDARARGVDHLLRAAELAAEIPRAGRRHLVLLVFFAPRSAAALLAAGMPGEAAWLVERCRAILQTRGSVLAEIGYDPAAGPEAATLADAFRDGLALVEEVAAARAASPERRAAAAERVRAYGRRLGPLADALVGDLLALLR